MSFLLYLQGHQVPLISWKSPQSSCAFCSGSESSNPDSSPTKVIKFFKEKKVTQNRFTDLLIFYKAMLVSGIQ